MCIHINLNNHYNKRNPRANIKCIYGVQNYTKVYASYWYECNDTRRVLAVTMSPIQTTNWTLTVKWFQSNKQSIKPKT